MRTIKFRGKDINDNWLVGSYYEDVSWICILPEGVFGLTDTWDFRVDEKTVGQFTGMYDKNGKEIYEGDIVCVSFSYEYYDEAFVGKVIFMNYTFSVSVLMNHGKSGEYIFSFGCWKDIEVLGNIYDSDTSILTKY